MNRIKNLIALICLAALLLWNQVSWSQCTPPSLSVGAAITPTTATAYIYCSGPSTCIGTTYFLEYGLAGFTPGTAASPGIGGTIITVAGGGIASSTPINLSGLTPNTSYHAYARKNCSGTFSSNTPVDSFTTAFDCSAAISISCGSFNTINFPSGQGAWLTCNYYGREIIYSFTPTVSGYHILFVKPLLLSGCSFSYKADSGGCVFSGWTCIGYGSINNISQLSFGPLTAGTTYFIKAQNNNNNLQGNSAEFRVECPYCPAASNISMTNSTSSISLSWTGYANILEYGPHNFIPGTGTMAGPGGTIQTTFGLSCTLTGLLPGTAYDFYLRTICGNNYSANSIRFAGFTLPCPQSNIYSPLGASYLLVSNSTGDYNIYNQCWYSTEGQESHFKFTPPSSGYYTVSVTYPFVQTGFYNFLTHISDGTCDVMNYSCMSITSYGYSGSSSVDYYTWGPLTGGSTYDLLFDLSDTANNNTFSFMVSCPQPDNISYSDIRPTSAIFTWSCNCTGSTYLEYGPAGFTPGTGATAGINGTVKANLSSPYTLTGLTPDTKYDVYIRNSCGGVFTANSPKILFQTAQTCSAAQPVNCGEHVIYSVASSGSLAGGAWNSTACGNINEAREGMWSFTPAQTGQYSILVYGFSSGNYNWSYNAKFFKKITNTACNENSWSCLGGVVNNGMNFTPATFSLGTLTSGNTYVIMADATKFVSLPVYKYYFRIECQGVCGSPMFKYAYPVTATTATINMMCDTCFGNLILEYGPQGFTPGTGATAGVNGTALAVSVFPYTITGLTPLTGYDVYARQNCGGGFYSANSTKLSFGTVCNVPPVSITSNLGVNICIGTTVTLTQNGGSVAPGGSFKWYESLCGGTLVATGPTATFSPTATTSYFVRGESSCGNSACKSITITVNPIPNANITSSGPITFCFGNSVLLNTAAAPGQTYQWKKSGTAIGGAVSSSFIATTSGTYKVTVADSVTGCSKTTSTGTVITVNPLPIATNAPQGPTTFCAGDSVLLKANYSANFSYQWIKKNTNINGAVTHNYFAKAAGTYKVKVTNANGCTNISKAVTVSVPCREESQTRMPGMEVKVIPNPSHDHFNLTVNNSSGELLTISVYDMTGRVIKDVIQQVSPTEFTISGLLNGIYMAEVKQGTQMKIIRLVKTY